jgi:hypothetical protein
MECSLLLQREIILVPDVSIDGAAVILDGVKVFSVSSQEFDYVLNWIFGRIKSLHHAHCFCQQTISQTHTKKEMILVLKM